MKVRLVDRPDVTVAYLRHVGPYGAPLARFWREKACPWLETEGLLGEPRYGVSHDDPGITAPAKCRYDACVEVGPRYIPGGKAQVMTIPGGRYAFLPFEGRVEDIAAAWNALLREWLPASGLQLDARPAFEHYPRGSRFDPATGIFDCGICVPVAPL